MTRQNWGTVAGPPDPGTKQQARPNSCRLPKKGGPFRELFQLWLGRFEHLFFNGRDGGKIAEDFSAASSLSPLCSPVTVSVKTTQKGTCSSWRANVDVQWLLFTFTSALIFILPLKKWFHDENCRLINIFHWRQWSVQLSLCLWCFAALLGSVVFDKYLFFWLAFSDQMSYFLRMSHGLLRKQWKHLAFSTGGA